jgi:cytochrome c553
MKYYLVFFVAALLMGCGESESTQTHTKKEVTHTVQTHEVAPKKEVQEATKQTEVSTPAATLKKEIKKQTAVATKTVKKAIDGKALYAKCQGCHGAKGTNKALNKSAPIAGWDVNKLVKVMSEYKNKSRNVYGMGSVMQAQVKTLSEEEMKALADYISKL